MHLKDEEIFEGIKKRNSKVAEFVYRKYFPGFRNFVLMNNGNLDDAKDIFQEAIIVIFRNFNKKDFKLTSSFDTYIYSICKNLWGKSFREERKRYEQNSDLNNYQNVSEEDEETINSHQEYKVYYTQFRKLSKDCQKVLRLFARKIPLKEIAQVMGYSQEYAKKRKYVCKKRLVENIKKLEKNEKFKHHL